jgi:uncharacterized membrane protein YqiK
VSVLREREIAKQQQATFAQQEAAQKSRTSMEAAKGTADMQAQLAQAQVNVTIEQRKAEAKKAQAEGEASFTERMGRAKGAARTAEADGEAAYLQRTGDARGAEVRSIGLARAESFEKQKEALGPQATALLNLAEALGKIAGEIKIPLMPHTLVTGGGGTGASPVLGGVGTALMEFLQAKAASEAPPPPKV